MGFETEGVGLKSIGMLSLAAKRGRSQKSQPSEMVATFNNRPPAGFLILPTTLKATRQGIHYILVIETTIKTIVKLVWCGLS